MLRIPAPSRPSREAVFSGVILLLIVLTAIVAFSPGITGHIVAPHLDIDSDEDAVKRLSGEVQRLRAQQTARQAELDALLAGFALEYTL